MTEYWYNLETGVVEEGMVSPGYDRAGPFSSREEAARAPEIIKERSRAWAAEDAAQDGWRGEDSGGEGSEGGAEASEDDPAQR
ncbi:SPOR domain-containing protein [Agrococcus beijingensis]|uniref:SPOR domain-containing protein n=1 Tax=Agrococcus beijingensis TaxID=3068634 RepID=UPI0027425658|nr:SPOR domain-containing protein [Agrococcus sp. REN33]